MHMSDRLKHVGECLTEITILDLLMTALDNRWPTNHLQVTVYIRLYGAGENVSWQVTARRHMSGDIFIISSCE